MNCMTVAYVLACQLDHDDPSPDIAATLEEQAEATRIAAKLAVDSDTRLTAATAGDWMREHYLGDRWLLAVAQSLVEFLD